MIGYKCSWILRDGGDVDFSWIREVFVGTVDGFSKNYEVLGKGVDYDFILGVRMV